MHVYKQDKQNTKQKREQLHKLEYFGSDKIEKIYNLWYSRTSNRNNSYTVGDIIEGVVSFIPGGQIVAAAALMQVIANNSAKRSIKAADGYAEVLSIVSGAESGTYVSGWNNHPYGTIPDVGTTVVDYCAA